MSMPDHQAVPPPPPPKPRSGAVQVLLVALGVVLLMPGICSFIAMGSFGAGGGLIGIYLVTFAIAGLGIWLIASARGRR